MSKNEHTSKNLVTEPALLLSDTEQFSGGIPVGQQLLLVGGIFLLIFATTVTPRIISSITSNSSDTSTDNSYTELTFADETTVPIIEPFSDLSLVGNAIYVWDIKKQRALFKKNEATMVPLASVTKLMTALLAHELLQEDAAITISETAILQSGDSGLLDGEIFSRLSLSDLVLMSSSNDGAYALATAAGNQLDASRGATAFVQAMNIRAKEIGLTNTEYKNPTGLDVSPSEAGALGTARDMAFLMEYLVEHNPELLAATQFDTERVYNNEGRFHDTENTNYYLDQIPGLIGSKTGYTDLAGGNLVIAYDAGLNRPIIISVLGSTQTNRFTDIMTLINATNSYLAQE